MNDLAYKPLLDKTEMLEVLEEIDEFTESEEFKNLVNELKSLPDRNAKYDFVRNVVINKNEQEKRGIFLPEGMFIQRSYFSDDRPTLFCIVKYLKDGKRKMTITYDDDIPKEMLTRI
ncbi:hypothetical protein SAMN05443429_10225 [Cruoricaptor ignavus]|uniref:Uncharacterized protein n=1 Tax=Cruoricaptor ignavus TaxID=1118202 RepID=A0A1M6BJ92_9FLAO|nr:hypothetical protein [Cruoricaptor ignavus]SHI48756.1 hypothetical protein SAMN05443429_10225 [Cruoricaptor ignavus]